MSEDIKQKIADYLKSHEWLNLGTVDKDGRPMVHTVAYASDNAVVYFSTAKTTRKVANMLSNPHVAYTVDDDKVNVMEITGVQMEGKASIITDEKEAGKVFDLMLEKFPFIKDMPKDNEHILFKVEPEKAFFLDYKKGFAYRDTVTY